MLHLRVTCPAEVTDAVLDCLRKDSGTVHLVLLRGAAVDPPGDLIQADVAREAADGVLAALRALGVDHVGGITLEPVDTVLSDAADAASRPRRAIPRTRWCGTSSSREPAMTPG